MTNKSRLTGSVLSAFVAVMMLAVPVAGNAQETSSAVRGVVTDDSGNALTDAIVTVRSEASGFSRSSTTSGSGDYAIRNLPIDIYTISVSSSGFAGQESPGLNVNLGQTANINFVLTSDGDIEEIVVTASATQAVQVALGPSASFDLEALQAAPAINRNITDVLRGDSRIYVDESRGGINAVQCGGKNPRYNSLTVDGVRMNDSFGLNSNGYPTERMPFSYDAINQVSVELAPFDVQYGGFSACNINAVTKSGGNQFSGSAFYDYTSDSLRGDSLEGDDIESGAYTEKRYGVTFGGPIIEDKLFFFAAYEKLEGADLMDRGVMGSGAVNELNVTQADLDTIAEIARTVYLYDPGFIPSAMAHEDEKLLARFDWNVSDRQRLAFTYTYNDGFGNVGADRAQDEIEFSNHYYSRQTELNSYAGALYSDWSDKFSTEVRVSYLNIDALHAPIGGTDFGEMRIELGRDSTTPSDVDVYLGSDDSRQANKLDYDVTSVSLKGTYFLDGHSLTFGVEREALEVFNLFVQHSETELRFNSIDDFRTGFADDIYYNNAPSHNPSEAAAVWGYELNTLFAQDEMDIADNLSIVFGLRYDWYTSDDRPGENPEFVADYGFSNNGTFDGEGLVQPRFGFTWDLSGDTSVHGGLGLYSGGDPNVWLSNAYSGNNILQFGSYLRDIDITGFTWEDIEANAPAGAGAGWGIPTQMHDQVSGGTGSNFEMSYVDPDFKLPKEYKLALGVNHVFPGDYVVTADLLLTKGVDSPRIERSDLAPNGFSPDGHPLYLVGDDTGLEPAFALTNSDHGTRSTVISLGLAKAIGDSFDYRLGYSYTDAEDSNPMTSSVSFSNYTNRAFFDPQEDVLATSNYAIKNRFVATANWRKDFSSSTRLMLSLYGSYNSGRPYTIGINSADVHGFDLYLGDIENLLAPGTERNSETGSSWTKLDFKATLDMPGFGDEHRASVFVVVDNLTNLLNDDWGVLYQHNFPRTIEAGTAESRLGDASRYEIRFGVQYSF